MNIDAIVVGSGPNGLSAAITLARAGLSVSVYEARSTVGGGTRSAALTEAGFLHDVCSAVHPMATTSPCFRKWPLAEHGLEWVYSDVQLAHPFDDGTAALMFRSIDETAGRLDGDADGYRATFEPLTEAWKELFRELMQPLRIPSQPLLAARFGVRALQSTMGYANRHFGGQAARGLFAGVAAHAQLPLEAPGSVAFALMLMTAGHACGWPLARGGSQKIADALAGYLKALGGSIETERPIRSLTELPQSRVVLFDTAPRTLLEVAGDELPSPYRSRVARYRHATGVFKLDWALSGPIPWTASECRRAPTVHLGGSLNAIAAAERSVAGGRLTETPFVLLVQPSLFDDTRAPPGKHTAWAYCHVPLGSPAELTGAVERQIERFAPGFRDCILARHTISARELERYNANYVGGDIGGGSNHLLQLLGRPILRWDPYSTPNPKLYLCSSATPPGGGVHGMCGYWAARSALGRAFA